MKYRGIDSVTQYPDLLALSVIFNPVQSESKSYRKEKNMEDDKEKKINEFERGLGIAGLLLSMSILSALITKKIITKNQANQLIDHARSLSKNPDYFPGNANTISASDRALGWVRDVVVLDQPIRKASA